MSRDGGESWTFFDVFPSSTFESRGGRLATGRSDGTLAVLTPSGVATSGDDGKTWRALAVEDPRSMARVVIDPAGSDTIYLGQRSGLGSFRSSDGGRTWIPWTIALPPRSSGGGEVPPRLTNGKWELGFSELVIAPSDPRVWYAIAFNDVVSSRDRGATWERTVTVPSNVFSPTGPIAFVSIAVAPTDANVAYALRSDGMLYASDGPTAAWRSTAVAGAKTLAVSPVDPLTIAVGGGTGVHVSQDGGRSFQTLLADMGETFVFGFEPWGAHRLYAWAFGGLSFRSGDDLTKAATASLTAVAGMASMDEIGFVATRPGRILGLGSQGLVATNGD